MLLSAEGKGQSACPVRCIWHSLGFLLRATQESGLQSSKDRQNNTVGLEKRNNILESCSDWAYQGMNVYVYARDNGLFLSEHLSREQ